MAFVPKEKHGSLFKNKKKTSENHPDYTGSIMLDGKERWLSAWLKDYKDGKFLSVSIGEPKESPQAKQDNDLPY
jgi:uncharacterized protein (DUF736 family)